MTETCPADTRPVVSEVVMWQRPLTALLMLACGTLVWYFCGPLQRSVVSLFSDVLLTLACSLGLLGFIRRRFHLIIPVDPLEWRVSTDAAHDVAACLANTVGAAEGVLRVAASGSDGKLFSKVVLILYVISAIGRAASGATVAYIVLLFVFIVPIAIAKFAPEGTSTSPPFLNKNIVHRKPYSTDFGDGEDYLGSQ